QELKEKLGIGNIAFHVGRVEDMKAERDTFDIVTARGFAAMNIFLEVAAPLAKKGGTLIAMKSLRGEEELVKSKFAIHRLGLSLSSTKKDVLPDGEIRLNYYFEKKQPTPPSYPRPWAEILKKPL
ncbi:class I SAM-dependent methyltransferase, partial [bacterium]|nr:class I SAM-dependent methyltransferase [bacterium]